MRSSEGLDLNTDLVLLANLQALAGPQNTRRRQVCPLDQRLVHPYPFISAGDLNRSPGKSPYRPRRRIARFACQTGFDNANLPSAESGAWISPWRWERIVVACPRQIDDFPRPPRPIHAPVFRHFFAEVLPHGQVLR